MNVKSALFCFSFFCCSFCSAQRGIRHENIAYLIVALDSATNAPLDSVKATLEFYKVTGNSKKPVMSKKIVTFNKQYQFTSEHEFKIVKLEKKGYETSTLVAFSTDKEEVKNNKDVSVTFTYLLKRKKKPQVKLIEVK